MCVFTVTDIMKFMTIHTVSIEICGSFNRYRVLKIESEIPKYIAHIHNSIVLLAEVTLFYQLFYTFFELQKSLLSINNLFHWNIARMRGSRKAIASSAVKYFC